MPPSIGIWGGRQAGRRWQQVSIRILRNRISLHCQQGADTYIELDANMYKVRITLSTFHVPLCLLPYERLQGWKHRERESHGKHYSKSLLFFLQMIRMYKYFFN